MSKTLGTILIIAAVAFAIAVPVFGPAALGLTAASAAAISAGISAAIMINSLLMPMPSGPTRQAAATTLQLGEAPRAVVFGEIGLAGSLVDAFNFGGEYGTDWEVVIAVLADHLCEGLTEFFVNDQLVTFAGDGPVSGYNGQLEVYFRSGTASQTLPSVVSSQGPGWSNPAAGQGLCYVVYAYKADEPDADNPVWPGGRPRFLWVVKGKKCYDPRKDSTVPGGSGAHRWATPSTWEWTDNLIICRYNWVRGVYALDQVSDPTQLLVGRGLSAIEAPPEFTFAPANLCDELVGGEKRFRADGIIYSNQKFLDVEEEFAAACGGVIIQREGSVEIEPAQAKAPSFAFTDADILVGSTVSWNWRILSDASSEWVNTVVAKYVEPAQKWGEHAAPVRRDTGDLIADGGPREQSITLNLVKRATQAGVIAEVARRMGRLWGRAEVKLGPRFAEIEEGDWGTWTSDRLFGGATITFRVESYGLDQKWQNALRLREMAASVYAPVTGLTDGAAPFTPTTPPTLVAPPGADWTLAGGDVAGSNGTLPALLLTGACSITSCESILFEYRVHVGGLGDNDNWIAAGVEAASIQSKTITGILSGTDYDVSIRYRVQGLYTPRRIEGPAASGGAATVTQLIAQSSAVGLTFSVDSTGVFNLSTHSRVYADKTVSVTGNASFSSGASPADLALIYYDDPSRAGGPVTYQSLVLAGGTGDTSSAYPSPAHPYRHFVCQRVVPATGTSGGGSGAGSGGGAGGGGIGGGGVSQ